MGDMELVGKRAKNAALKLQTISEEKRNEILSRMKTALTEKRPVILNANQKDLEVCACGLQSVTNDLDF
jgi:gamma-glutamyl phosphate reductase